MFTSESLHSEFKHDVVRTLVIVVDEDKDRGPVKITILNVVVVVRLVVTVYSTVSPR